MAKLKKIVKANITHVSLVPKGANGIDFLITKGENVPQVTVDIPILKVNEEKKIVTGVVYEPNVVDSQGDFMDAETIEKTAYDYMENQQNIDIKHDFKTNENLKVVESYITKSDTTIGNKNVKTGTWVMSVKINDDDVWEKVKKGEINGFSMGGTGVKEVVEEPVKKEEQGVIDKIKELLGLSTIEKAEKAVAKPSINFGAKLANESINSATWAMRDAISDVLRNPQYPNKKASVLAVIDDFKEYCGTVLSTQAGIKKAAEDIEKGDDEMLSQEVVTKTVEEAVKPLQEQIEELKKSVGQEETPVEKTEEEKQVEMIAKAVEEVTKPLQEQVEKLSKMRGLPMAKQQETTQIEKSEEEQLREETRSLI